MNRLLILAMFMMNATYVIAGRVMVGACQDKNGCNLCAGYSWCEGTQECHRPWEVNCLNLEPKDTM